MVPAFVRDSLVFSLALFTAVSLSSRATASILIEATEDSATSTVTFTATGSANTSKLIPPVSPSSATPGIEPDWGIAVVGISGLGDYYSGITGPTDFGTFGPRIIGSGDFSTGPIVGVLGNLQQLVLPVSYQSGAAISSTNTYSNSSFVTLGLTPGIYQWTWGSDEDEDSLTLQIEESATVPEPASLAIWAGLGIAGLVVRLRRTRLQAAQA